MGYRMKYNRIGIISILWFLWGASGTAQELYYEQYTELDGLPSLMTYEMLQDENGLLWVGTENGLVSFDGDKFQRYSHPGLYDNDIIEITLSKDGRVYFVNLKGQMAFVEKGIVHLLDPKSIPNKIVEIEINENQNLVVTRDPQKGKTKIYKFFYNDKGDIEFEKTDYDLILVADNKIYTCNYNSTTKVLEFDSTKLQLNKSNIYRLYNSSDSLNYYLSPQRIIYQLDGANFDLIDKKNIQHVAVSKNKSFIFPEKGVYMYHSNSQKFNYLLGDIQVNTAFVDEERNVWFSTPRDGLFKFPFLDFQIDIRDEIFVQDYGVNDFLIDEYGNIYIGTTTGQLLQYSKHKKLVKSTLVSSDFKPVSLLDTKSAIFGFGGRSIFKMDKVSNEIDVLKNTLFGPKTFLLDNDSLLIGSRGGLHKFSFTDFIKPDSRHPKEMNGKWINTLHKDSENNVFYVGTRSGLYVVDDAYNFEQIPLDSASNYSISDLAAGKDNSIWVGTRNNGAFRIRGADILERYNKSNGLISNHINSIKITDDKLIVSTLEGVSIKNLSTGEEGYINEMSGVIPQEILTCDLVNGEYWLASNAGLIVIKPDQLQYFKKKGPRLSVKDFYANGMKVDFDEPLKFSHDINTVLINFRNVSLRKGSARSIKYKINSSDTSWVYTSDPLIRLQSLKHGSYQIEAIGISDEKEEGNKVSLAFTITPPWWETLWARILGAIGTIGIFRYFVGRRAKRVRKEETVKRNYLTQINKIKDQALQLQMNPHFIFNSLNAIQGFIGTDDEEMAMNYLARFARLIRLIFEHSKGNTITLEEELEFMNLYLDLEKLRFKDKVDVQVKIDPELERIKDVLRVPPLLIQPIVENSFKHGLFHKKGKGHLNIDYIIQNKMLQVTIQDDGIGRVESNKIAQRNNEKQTSSGIKTTIERIDLLNFGKNQKMNSVVIEDLYDKEDRSTGTKTIIKLEVL